MAPAVEEVSEMAVVAPEQIIAVGKVVTTGLGLTVTVIVEVVPVQLFAVGVTIYCTVPDVVPAFVNVCAIDEPLPAA